MINGLRKAAGEAVETLNLRHPVSRRGRTVRLLQFRAPTAKDYAAIRVSHERQMAFMIGLAKQAAIRDSWAVDQLVDEDIPAVVEIAGRLLQRAWRGGV